jgi:hypothetical protein
LNVVLEGQKWSVDCTCGDGQESMFKLNLRNIRERCLQVNIEDKVSPWHLRFRHLQYDGLKELTKKDMVHGLSDMDYIKKIMRDV